MKLVRASAVVEVRLRVTLGSAWGSDCQLDQVYRQASREAVEKIQNAMNGRVGFTIIDEPKVKTIITEDQ